MALSFNDNRIVAFFLYISKSFDTLNHRLWLNILSETIDLAKTFNIYVPGEQIALMGE